ncbi:polyphosphate polymerase domain-containing protein [Galactobacillus timonensis]|uniref:polyphosphate polymerase domain-containing protein n=1 Tax=Galactobacillus timonensis TaxID=2041840 RepID=UPI00240A08F6|nr:polyphosphate polymerase domain-containing protein [Galactobacillus timonensis]MDD6681096.1 polyphosphate polymerase domain-containing protein [Galactobacillus timonensis]
MIRSETFLRVEEKFHLSSAQAEQFLIAARDHLTPDIYPEYDLNTIYYDTPDFYLINHCLNHPLYRLKLRLRSYGNPAVGAPVFLETKQRLGDWGEKRRVALTYNEQFSCALKPDDLPRDGQIAGELRQVLETYAVEPKVFIAYHRMAFAADNDLRITLDTRIRSRMKNVNLVLGGTEVRTTHMGMLNELQYRISLKQSSQEQALINELRMRNGNLTIRSTIQEPVTARLFHGWKSGRLSRYS